jgi:hypothetical protein
MSDDLDTLSDAQLNELFAVEAAGYVLYTERREPPMSKLETPERWCYRDREGTFYLGEPYSLHADAYAEIGLRHGYMWARPKFCADMNAVLPVLEKYQWQSTRWDGRKCGREADGLTYWVNVPMGAAGSTEGVAPTLARAAVLALIRWARISAA